MSRRLPALAPLGAVAIAAAGLLACDHHGVQQPERMDMDGLVDAYRAPTAALDQHLLDTLAGGITQRIELARRGNPLGYVSEHVIDPALLGGLGGDSSDEQERERPRGPYGIRAAGFARVAHVCDGAGSPHPADRVKDGWLELYFTFNQAGIDPVVWGSASGCRYQEGGHETYFDGALGIHHRERLFYLGGSLFLDGSRVVSEGIDFRAADGGLQFRLPAREGHVFLTVSGKRLAIRATNGAWECETLKARCTRTGSGDELHFNPVMTEQR